MMVLLAPARNVRPVGSADEQPVGPARERSLEHDLTLTRPLFIKQAAKLAKLLCAYSPWQLESLLDVPPQRAFELHDAYRAFNTKKPGWPALLTYYGAAYRKMAPQEFTPRQMAFAQQHLRILSAFYGLLRPLDGILEHRLGLKKDFQPGGQDLYAFWGDSIYKELFRQKDAVVNLASVEYAKLVLPHLRPGNRVVTCRFLLEGPDGARGTVSTVRAARGLMANYIVQNSIIRPEDLCGFAADGYAYSTARSSPAEYVFLKRKAHWPGP